jgi:hypothetical protein
MALKVIKKASEVDTEKGTIVVESDHTDGVHAYAELRGADARRLAIKVAAADGLPDPRINGSVSSYPVDAKGKEITDPSKQSVAKFRADIPVIRKLF